MSCGRRLGSDLDFFYVLNHELLGDQGSQLPILLQMSFSSHHGGWMVQSFRPPVAGQQVQFSVVGQCENSAYVVHEFRVTIQPSRRGSDSILLK
jgi:hypothetical protein